MRPPVVLPRPAPVATPSPTPASTSRVLQNMLHLASGQMAATGAALVWLYFVPRAIGPVGMGEIAIATSIGGLLSILLNPGVGVLLCRDVARFPSRAGSLVGSGVLVRLVGALPAVVFILVYKRLLHVGSEEAVLIWLAGASTLIAALSGVIQAAFTGLEQMQYLAWANAIGNALVRLAGIAVVLVGLGVVAIMQANVALTALVLVLNLLWMRRHFTPRWRPRASEVGYVLRSSLTFWVGSLIFTTYLWIDTVILSTMAPVSVVGWYNTPTQIFAALLMIPGVIGTAWFPRFARAFQQGGGTLRSAARPALETIVMLSLPVSGGLAAVAWPLIGALYGPGFYGAVWPLVILALTMIPTFFNMLAYQVLLASDRQNAWIRVLLAATAVNVATNVVLIGWFQAHLHNGAIGAALSLLVTEVFQSVFAFLLLPGVFGIAFLGRLGRGLVAAAGMAGLVLLPARLGLYGRLGLVLEIGIGLASFIGLALVLRVPSQAELGQIRAVWGRVRRLAGAAA